MAPFIQTNTKNSIIFKILSTRSLHLVHSRHAFSIAHQMNKVCHYVERLQFLNPVEHLNLSVCSYGWTPNRHVIKVWTYAQNTSRSLDSIVTTIWSPFLFAKHHFDILQIFLYRLHSWNFKCQSTQLLTAWGHSQFKPTDKTTCGVGPHTFPLSQVRVTLQADVFESTLPMHTVSERVQSLVVT